MLLLKILPIPADVPEAIRGAHTQPEYHFFFMHSVMLLYLALDFHTSLLQLEFFFPRFLVHVSRWLLFLYHESHKKLKNTLILLYSFLVTMVFNCSGCCESQIEYITGVVWSFFIFREWCKGFLRFLAVSLVVLLRYISRTF